MPRGPGPAIDALIDDLAGQGWARCSEFLSADEWQPIQAQAHSLFQSGALRPAQIGQGAQRQERQDIRSDQVLWINEAQGAVRVYLERMEALRHELNQALYLGLDHFEAHWAAYPPGSFYQRHRDQFHGAQQRVVSTVFYLNPGWQPADGGQLRLHLLPDQPNLDILPQGGTLVIFLSDSIEHEVLAAQRQRYSITGWLRRRNPQPLA